MMALQVKFPSLFLKIVIHRISGLCRGHLTCYGDLFFASPRKYASYKFSHVQTFETEILHMLATVRTGKPLTRHK